MEQKFEDNRKRKNQSNDHPSKKVKHAQTNNNDFVNYFVNYWNDDKTIDQSKIEIFYQSIFNKFPQEFGVCHSGIILQHFFEKLSKFKQDNVRYAKYTKYNRWQAIKKIMPVLIRNYLNDTMENVVIIDRNQFNLTHCDYLASILYYFSALKLRDIDETLINEIVDKILEINILTPKVSADVLWSVSYFLENNYNIKITSHNIRELYKIISDDNRPLNKNISTCLKAIANFVNTSYEHLLDDINATDIQNIIRNIDRKCFTTSITISCALKTLSKLAEYKKYDLLQKITTIDMSKMIDSLTNNLSSSNEVIIIDSIEALSYLAKHQHTKHLVKTINKDDVNAFMEFLLSYHTIESFYLKKLFDSLNTFIDNNFTNLIIGVDFVHISRLICMQPNYSIDRNITLLSLINNKFTSVCFSDLESPNNYVDIKRILQIIGANFIFNQSKQSYTTYDYSRYMLSSNLSASNPYDSSKITSQEIDQFLDDAKNKMNTRR